MGRQSGIPVSQSLLRLMTGLACSLLLLTGLIHLVERSGSEVNLSRVFESLKGIPLEIIVLYTLVVVMNTVARTVRYRLLVDARADVPRTRFTPLLIVTAVRNMVVDLLPAARYRYSDSVAGVGCVGAPDRTRLAPGFVTGRTAADRCECGCRSPFVAGTARLCALVPYPDHCLVVDASADVLVV